MTLVLVAVAVGVASGATTVAVTDETVPVEGQTMVPVTLEEAPDGVQRYNLTVSLANGSVARIDGAEAGDVAGFQVRSQTADSVTFRAADLGRTAQANATNVVLGSITVSGLQSGRTALLVTVHDFQTDGGEGAAPSVSEGTVRVGDGDPTGATSGHEERDGPAERDVAGVGIPVALGVGTLLVIVALGIVGLQARRTRD